MLSAVRLSQLSSHRLIGLWHGPCFILCSPSDTVRLSPRRFGGFVRLAGQLPRGVFFCLHRHGRYVMPRGDDKVRLGRATTLTILYFVVRMDQPVSQRPHSEPLKSSRVKEVFCAFLLLGLT